MSSRYACGSELLEGDYDCCRDVAYRNGGRKFAEIERLHAIMIGEKWNASQC